MILHNEVKWYGYEELYGHFLYVSDLCPLSFCRFVSFHLPNLSCYTFSRLFCFEYLTFEFQELLGGVGRRYLLLAIKHTMFENLNYHSHI